MKAGSRRALFAEGFDAAGIAAPDAIREAGADLYAYLEAGFHGDMGWLADKADRRTGPIALWPDVRSVVMLGMNYGPERDPLAAQGERSHAAISVYAQGRDYHDIVKGKLKAVAREFAARSGADVKVFVDTAPVMEKPLAQAAGLGWQGKHTNLVSRAFGSWLFLGAIFTTAALRPDAAEQDRCGSCRRCLDICPTRAFPAPHRIDARRCISYLTIEHKEQIPLEFREAIGKPHLWLRRLPRRLSVEQIRARPRARRGLRRSKARIIRRLPISSRSMTPPSARASAARPSSAPAATASSATCSWRPAIPAIPRCIGAVLPLLADASPLVRGMAVWALRRLATMEMAASLKARHYPAERDGSVLAEWDRVL